MIGYAKRTRKYRESWINGYRMSNKSYDTPENPTNDNYIALILAILANKTSDDALRAMDLLPQYTYTKTPKYKLIGECVYILHNVCGVQKKDIAKVLDVGFQTLNDALKYSGVYTDCRRRVTNDEQ